MTREVDAKKLKRKRLSWSKASEEVLLDLWPSHLEKLQTERKKGHIYVEMAYEMSKLGFSYSPQNVHVKLQNFTQRYRKENAAMLKSGKSSSTWSHYKRVHQIIGDFKSNSFYDLTLESIEDSSSSLSSSCTPLSVPSSPLPPVTQSSEPSASASSIGPANKKRKLRFKATIMENFEKLSTAIMEHLKKSEENERELIAIEKKKADSLDSIAKDNREFKNALISYLNKK